MLKQARALIGSSKMYLLESRQRPRIRCLTCFACLEATIIVFTLNAAPIVCGVRFAYISIDERNTETVIEHLQTQKILLFEQHQNLIRSTIIFTR